MIKIIFVKPASGVRVLDPDTIPPSPLPPEGKKVVQDPYWLRRIKAGEVLLVREESLPARQSLDADSSPDPGPDKISPNKGK